MEWQAESGTGVRGLATVEGDRWNLWTWHCRLLICCYCECELGPGPGASLSACSLATGSRDTVSEGRSLGTTARTQFFLSVHFSKLGREVSFWSYFFSRVFQKEGPFSLDTSIGLN